MGGLGGWWKRSASRVLQIKEAQIAGPCESFCQWRKWIDAPRFWAELCTLHAETVAQLAMWKRISAALKSAIHIIAGDFISETANAGLGGWVKEPALLRRHNSTVDALVIEG